MLKNNEEKTVSHFASIDQFISSIDQAFEIDPVHRVLLENLDLQINSSYTKHSFSKLFYFLTYYLKPTQISEFGVLGCYSIISMALCAKHFELKCSITGYDLFEDYSYTSFALSDAIERVDQFGLKNDVQFQKCNALDGNLIENTLLESDLTHIDLSNEGDIYSRILSSEFKKDSIIILEGGSIERDATTWIKEYGAREIAPTIQNFASQRNDIKISVINSFPSVTILQA